MHEADHSHHSTFHVDGCCVLWYREILRHNLALWPSVRIVGSSIFIVHINLIVSFSTDRKFKVMEEGKFSAQRKWAARVPQGSVLDPTVVQYYINNFLCPLNSSCIVRGWCMYLRDIGTWTTYSLQTATRPHFSIFAAWELKYKDQWKGNLCDLFLQKLCVLDDALQLRGRDIACVSNVTYLGVIFYMRMTCRRLIERSVAKGLAHVYNDLFSICSRMFKYRY